MAAGGKGLDSAPICESGNATVTKSTQRLDIRKGEKQWCRDIYLDRVGVLESRVEEDGMGRMNRSASVDFVVTHTRPGRAIAAKGRVQGTLAFFAHTSLRYHGPHIIIFLNP